MKLSTTLPTGIGIYTLSFDEMCAMIDYALLSLEDGDGDVVYPLNLLGLDKARIEQRRVAGYNELLNEKLVVLDDEGYATLTDDITESNYDFVASVICLREAQTFIRFTISSSSQVDYYIIASGSDWIITAYNARANMWVLLHGHITQSVGMTMYSLVTQTMRNLPIAQWNTGTQFTMTWYTVQGEPISGMEEKFKVVDGVLYGYEPESSLLKDQSYKGIYPRSVRGITMSQLIESGVHALL